MSLLPAFKIGLWNAWILTTILFLFMMLTDLLPKDIRERITPVKEVKKIQKITMIVFFTMVIYSIFLPLKMKTIWFYAGIAVYIIGFLICSAALFSIAATKPGEPFTTGMYRYSRHPLVLGTACSMVGIGIASASWLFLLLSIILMVISHFLVITEENATRKKFGDAYKKYIDRTPRWIGLPKSKKT